MHIKEAKSLGITLVGISDTNNNPGLLDYVIPANDDSVKSLAYIFKKLEEAILEGKANPVQEKVEKKPEEKKPEVKKDVKSEKKASVSAEATKEKKKEEVKSKK